MTLSVNGNLPWDFKGSALTPFEHLSAMMPSPVSVDKVKEIEETFPMLVCCFNTKDNRVTILVVKILQEISSFDKQVPIEQVLKNFFSKAVNTGSVTNPVTHAHSPWDFKGSALTPFKHLSAMMPSPVSVDKVKEIEETFPMLVFCFNNPVPQNMELVQRAYTVLEEMDSLDEKVPIEQVLKNFFHHFKGVCSREALSQALCVNN